MAKRQTTPARQPNWAAPRLAGLTFAVADECALYGQNWVAGRIRKEGGAAHAELTPRADYVVVRNDSPDRSDWERRAREVGRERGAPIRVLDVNGLFSLLVPTREQALAMFRAGAKGLVRWRSLCEYGPRDPVDLSGADLRGLDLRDLNLNECVLKGADLRQADLTMTALCRCDLTGADLRGAILFKGYLNDARLVGADLRGADLRVRNAGGVDLKGARIEGANFEGLCMVGMRFRQTQFAHGGRVGPNVRRLEKVARAATRFKTEAGVGLDSRTVGVSIVCRPVAGYPLAFWTDTRGSYGAPPGSLLQGMIWLANGWGRGKLRPDSVTVRHVGSPLRGESLKALARAAWCEVFGVEPNP